MTISPNQEVSNFGTKNRLLFNWLIPLGIFCLFVGVFFFNSRHVWDMVSQTQDIIFGSDTRETINQIKIVSFSEDTKKHLLFSATLSPVARSIQSITGLSQNKSIRLTLALAGALNIAGVYLFLKKFSSSIAEALLFTGFYSLFFTNFVIFSIPETYSMSNLLILVYIATLFAFRLSLNVYKSLLLSVIAAVASLYNPVLLSFMVIHIILLLMQLNWKRASLIALSNLGVGSSIYLLANYLLHESQFMAFVDRYVNRYASFHHFIDIQAIMTVFSSFYFFSILSPHLYMSPSLGYGDWLGYSDSILELIAMLMIVAFMVYAVVILIRKREHRDGFVLALLPWTVIMALAFLYFNPREAILYSSQILFPLTIVFLHAFKTIKWKPAIKYSVFGFCLAVIALTNISAFYNGVR